MIEKGDVAEVILIGKIKDGKTFQELKEPTPVIVGMKRLIPGLDEALIGMNPGEKKTVEIQPEKGFGKRDPNLVRLVPISAFKKSNIKPVPGAIVDVDGYPARVLSTSGGRVQIDFNHELAGKTLIYEIEVKSVIKNDSEKASVLTKKYFEKGVKTQANGEFIIEVNKDAYMDRGYLDKKAGLIAELATLGKPVKWVEIYKLEK